MYNSTSAPQFSNNPFIDDPTNSSSRFPDIGTLERSSSALATPSPPGYGYPSNNYSAGYPQQTGYGMQPQPQPQQYLQPPPIQQQQLSGSWQQQQQQQQQPGPSSPYGGYGTLSGFGSGLMSPQMTGMPYANTYDGGMGQQYPQQQQQYGGYPSPQYTGAGYPGFGGQQGYGAQSQPAPNVSEFDPLRSQAPSSNPGPGPNGQMHPREYIRSHKRELEMWDNVSWRQALSAFDALRNAWESHKGQIGMRLQQGGYYLGPVEGQRLQGLQKDAEHHTDSITASSVQMQEVLTGYRHSADFASKNRVRESLNAALVSLPDWPPQNW